jgi:hypothetical protein
MVARTPLVTLLSFALFILSEVYCQDITSNTKQVVCCHQWDESHRLRNSGLDTYSVLIVRNLST